MLIALIWVDLALLSRCSIPTRLGIAHQIAMKDVKIVEKMVIEVSRRLQRGVRLSRHVDRRIVYDHIVTRVPARWVNAFCFWKTRMPAESV